MLPDIEGLCKRPEVKLCTLVRKNVGMYDEYKNEYVISVEKNMNGIICPRIYILSKFDTVITDNNLQKYGFKRSGISRWERISNEVL